MSLDQARIPPARSVVPRIPPLHTMRDILHWRMSHRQLDNNVSTLDYLHMNRIAL
ncbi:hypothetical protein M413DRAFT_445475 [Hebeloma cylindrosporum]|uniref:Uncharacterized protein n=1 Tax=Hebeloma cylindrosporum TaxID=76867 RepID=A0A0C2XUY0_HEBCY|nr:hypothetical protein M413DRAFT_445475 [Hebeloma cylindrosporum h7]